ncbi:hypothetical protein D3C86_1000020 [compost metagenome]
MAVHQVFALGAGVVRQTHFPQRQFEVRLLHVMRIEADRHQDEIAAVGAAFAEVQNVVVPGVVDFQAQMRVQRRILPADAVELGDLGNDVAGCSEIPGADLVLLGVEVFLFTRHRCRLAQLETGIHAPQARAHGRQHRANQKAGTPRIVEKRRVDVGRVDEEVRPVAFTPR